MPPVIDIPVSDTHSTVVEERIPIDYIPEWPQHPYKQNQMHLYRSHI
jgi:hypothetical protein